ncbi:mRNA decapping complex subunit 2 [Leucoagaricus sp. SymC.cos]|nr:mRNA decapping complex subunit 2 [Leucoagaricus sp. SymC.cos]
MASSSPEINSSVVSPEAQPRFSYKDASHEEVLEDLSSRFILNLPDEELASLERICFQVEQAHWFYEDFIREQNPTFPSLPLKKFSAMLFHACPLLHQWSNDHENAFNTFMQYKTRVPVCGAIMLNDAWDKCVLVKGWKSSSGWGFPKGKINEDEPKHVCAIREVLEETGYNLAGKLKPEDVIELSIKEQRISLFVVPGVEEDFAFQTKTRKEISVKWFRLSDLPTWKRNKQVPGKFYLISPFIGPLKAFINEHKSRPHRKTGRQKKNSVVTDADTDVVQESDSQVSDSQLERPEVISGNQSVVADVLKTDNMDPHFARLLNSLTLSASAEEREFNPKSSPHKLNLSTTSSHDFTRDSSCTPVATARQLQPLSPCQPPVHPQGALRSPSQARGSDAPAPANSPYTRRTIRTDISPYLTKASEENASARRLQQLALLEKVADESAKMLPQTRATTAALSSPLPMAHRGSPELVPPPVSGVFPPSHGVFYSSSPPQPQPSTSAIPSFPSFLSDGQMDRARTSQALHKGVSQAPSSQSMNQNQLLALMNSAQPLPPHPRSIQRPASNFGAPYPHSYPHPTLPAFPGPTTQMAYPTPRNLPPNLPPYGPALPAPNRFASATPAVDSFPPRVVPQSTAQTLLSILNGNRPLR